MKEIFDFDSFSIILICLSFFFYSLIIIIISQIIASFSSFHLSISFFQSLKSNQRKKERKKE
jgi:hypothetical protein